MTATGDGQDPQLYYDSFVNTLKGLDASLIVSATPECQYGSLGSNPMAGVVTTAQIDFFLRVLSHCACMQAANLHHPTAFNSSTTPSATVNRV